MDMMFRELINRLTCCTKIIVWDETCGDSILKDNLYKGRVDELKDYSLFAREVKSIGEFGGYIYIGLGGEL